MAETTGSTYSREEEIKNAFKLNQLLDALPRFTVDYFNSLEFTKQPRTKIAYAKDIKVFFEYITGDGGTLSGTPIREISIDDFDKITGDDISDYLRHCKAYKKNGTIKTNGERAIKRKLCSLRGFFGYYYRKGKITSDPSVMVDMPQIHDKAIIRMEPNEVAEFLDNVESGNKLTKAQLRFHNKLKVRDLALLTLMLGTGIRVSECVGLDINDVDFDNARIRVIRKGGSESFVYFGDEVEDALKEYMIERKHIKTLEQNEPALFISSQGKRLGVRSVEKLVKKYASTVTSVKHITPHKLRSTYGTNLYQESHDIYLVADVLGHKDVNTTRRHYADQAEENKRRARNIVRLRTDE